MIAKIKSSLSLMFILLFVFGCAMQTHDKKDSDESINNAGGNEISKGLEQIIRIPDDNLEDAIRDALGKPSGNIYKSDMEKIVELEANDRGIENLDGIQYCINIYHLSLNNNKITSTYHLRHLTNISLLNLGSNNLNSGYSLYLKNMNKLRFLYVERNDIKDISYYMSYLIDNPLDFINVEYNSMKIDFVNEDDNAKAIKKLLETGTTNVTYKNGNTVIGKP